MKEIVDERGGNTAYNPVAVILQIRDSNKENEGIHSTKLKKIATKVRELACVVHGDSGRVFQPNLRKTEITVKAEGARARDKLHAKWDEFEQYCEANGVTKRITSTGWIYVIK